MSRRLLAKIGGAIAVVAAALTLSTTVAAATPATSTGAIPVPASGSGGGAVKLTGSGTTAGNGVNIVFSTFVNANLPGMCLANHHPTVFMFGGCTGQYLDQYWGFNGNGQLVNYWSGACLAAHADSVVFTFDCGPVYADQIWRNYRGIPGMLENAHHAGQCLAAHSNGRVFLFPCTPAYADQYWDWVS